MANLPHTLSLNASSYGPGASSGIPTGAQPNVDRKMQSAELLVLDLSNPERRENALLELSKVVCHSPNSFISAFRIRVFCVIDMHG